jgi:hypothetical protein
MNLEEIRNQVNTNIDDEVDNDPLTSWINLGLDDLTPYAQYKKSTTINVVTGQTDYTLPADIHDIVVVGQNLRKLPLNDFTNYGYKVLGNTLALQPEPTEDITMQVIYNAILPHLEDDEDEPVIPSNFHNLLVLYVIAKYEFSNEELGFQGNATQEYERRKQDFIRYVNRQNPPLKIRDVYNMRWC